MGHIVKKILGDVHTDPEYNNLTIEYNSDGMAHIHLGAIRLDLVRDAYNQLFDGVMQAKKRMSMLHGWSEVINVYNNGHGTKYFEILSHGEELFFVPITKGLRFGNLSEEQKKKVEKYSSMDNNKVIEIKNSTITVGSQQGVLTKFYSGWLPLVVLDVCDFYPQDVFKNHQARYHSRMSNSSFAENLYNQILDEYQKFYNATGLYFSDISANNILISPDFTDFRIIDVESIDILNNDFEVEPHRLLCGHFPENRSNSKLPGPVGRAAEFLHVNQEENISWPKNLPDFITNSLASIKSRKIEVNK